MKIAIVASSSPPLISGGISSAHYNLALALRERGQDIGLFTFDDEQDALPADPPFVERTVVPVFLKRLIGLACRIYFRLLRDTGTLKWHLPYFLKCQVGAFIAGRKIRKFKPDVLVLPDNGCPGLGIGAIRDCRTVFISHHNPTRFDSPLVYGAQPSAKDIAAAVSLENRVLRTVDEVICPSRYMAACFRRTYAFSGPVRVIPNLLDAGLLRAVKPRFPAEELGLPPETPVVYIPSGTSPVKGARYVPEIIRRILEKRPDAAFYLSGQPDAAFSYELQATIPEDRVFCPGRLPYAANLAYVAGSTLCVSPTLIENFGVALIEAQYFGLPVVTFETGGNIEAIDNGVSGYCVEYLDIGTLVRRALEILSFDEAAMTRLRTAAMAHARAIASDETIDRYLDAFTSGRAQMSARP